MIVYIAEDNPADVYLLRIAFEEAGQQKVDLIVASDGEEALELVEHKGSFGNASRPDLIILDLNLPKSDGEDVLRFIRQRPEYNTIPVVVLTSSDSPKDRESVRQLGATCYLTKPSDLETFMSLGKTLVSMANHRGTNHARANTH